MLRNLILKLGSAHPAHDQIAVRTLQSSPILALFRSLLRIPAVRTLVGHLPSLRCWCLLRLLHSDMREAPVALDLVVVAVIEAIVARPELGEAVSAGPDLGVRLLFWFVSEVKLCCRPPIRTAAVEVDGKLGYVSKLGV